MMAEFAVYISLNLLSVANVLESTKQTVISVYSFENAVLSIVVQWKAGLCTQRIVFHKIVLPNMAEVLAVCCLRRIIRFGTFRFLFHMIVY
jgi:hypothetical protein